MLFPSGSALGLGWPGGAGLLCGPGQVTSLPGPQYSLLRNEGVATLTPLQAHCLCPQTSPVLQGLYWAFGSGLCTSLFPLSNPSTWIHVLTGLLPAYSPTSFSTTLVSPWIEKSNISLFLIQPQILIWTLSPILSVKNQDLKNKINVVFKYGLAVWLMMAYSATELCGMKDVLVRVLQRNRTNRTCEKYICKEIYYKELAQVITEMGRPQDLQWVSQLQTQDSGWCGLHLKTGRLETQDGPVFQLQSKDRKKADIPVWRTIGQEENSSLLGEGQTFCSSQAFNSLDEAHPHEGGQSALFCLPI